MTQDAETVARLESLAVDQRYRYERGDDPHPKQLKCAEALEAGVATIRSLSTRLAAAEAREAGLREALAFYADEENYNDNGAPETGGIKAPSWSKYDGDFISPSLDYGQIARAALHPEKPADIAPAMNGETK